MSSSDKAAGAGTASSTINWRILCIDDDPDSLFVLRAALSMRYEVLTALSGVEALKILGVCEPDFVICDIRMPGLDGFATVEAIRQIPTFTDVPVFFLTAETSRDAAKRGFAVGCNLYLTKPFDPTRLLENIDYFTRESGHTVRRKSHTLAEVTAAIETVRKSPAAAPETAPRAPAAPPLRPKAAPPAAATPAAPAPHAAVPRQEAYFPSSDLKAEHDAFLAERKAREREYWRKRYGEMQRFIDSHMR
jgi:CheY-like chemotaxis protein